MYLTVGGGGGIFAMKRCGGLYFYVYSVLLRIVHSQQNQNQAQCQKF